MNTVVTEPFNMFFDSSGSPVNGSLAIGLANLNPDTSPKSAYWDSALTIPAAQPITLSGGMPVRNGTPTPIFVNGDYSIIVRDLSSRIIYSSLASPKYAALPGPLEASTGAALVGYTSGLTGAVSRTVQVKLRDYLDVRDFGVTFDGVTDDTAAWQTAINNAGGRILNAPVGNSIVSSPLVLVDGVTIRGQGDIVSFLVYTGTTQGCFVTATGKYNAIRIEDLHIDIGNNTNAIAGIDARRGLVRGFFKNLRISMHPNNAHGFIVRGENPDSPGNPNQGQFYNQFINCIFKGASATQCVGYGLYFFGQDVSGMRCNNNTVIGGGMEGATAGVYINGQGNLIAGTAIEASPIGVYFEGNNCFANLLNTVYFDSPGVVKPVTIAASALGNDVFTAVNCVNLNDPTDVDSGATAAQPFGIISGGRSYWEKVYSPNVARAVVNFEVSGVGAITIKAQYNITSVVRNGVGDFTVTFDEDLPNAEIIVQGSCRRSTLGAANTLSAVVCVANVAGALSTTVCRIITPENLVTGALVDPDRVMVTFLSIDQ